MNRTCTGVPARAENVIGEELVIPPQDDKFRELVVIRSLEILEPEGSRAILAGLRLALDALTRGPW